MSKSGKSTTLATTFFLFSSFLSKSSCQYYIGFWSILDLASLVLIRYLLMNAHFFFFWFLILPGCSFKYYHLFSHEAQGRNVTNSLTVGMGFIAHMFRASHKQWEVAILILINTSASIKFRIVEMDDWLNLNKRPFWDSIWDPFASEANPWTAGLRYLLLTLPLHTYAQFCIIF